jgi:hypothetical protein
MFHMGWFVPGGGVQGWGTKWAGSIGRTWMLPDLYIDLSRALESAFFDYIIIEDSLMIADTFRGTMEYALAHAQTAPKNDPLPMLPLECIPHNATNPKARLNSSRFSWVVMGRDRLRSTA